MSSRLSEWETLLPNQGGCTCRDQRLKLCVFLSCSSSFGLWDRVGLSLTLNLSAWLGWLSRASGTSCLLLCLQCWGYRHILSGLDFRFWSLDINIFRTPKVWEIHLHYKPPSLRYSVPVAWKQNMTVSTSGVTWGFIVWAWRSIHGGRGMDASGGHWVSVQKQVLRWALRANCGLMLNTAGSNWQEFGEIEVYLVKHYHDFVQLSFLMWFRWEDLSNNHKLSELCLALCTIFGPPQTLQKTSLYFSDTKDDSAELNGCIKLLKQGHGMSSESKASWGQTLHSQYSWDQKNRAKKVLAPPEIAFQNLYLCLIVWQMVSVVWPG